MMSALYASISLPPADGRACRTKGRLSLIARGLRGVALRNAQHAMFVTETSGYRSPAGKAGGSASKETAMTSPVTRRKEGRCDGLE